MYNNTVFRVSDVNWKTWIPKENAVLSFIVDNDKVMLIHKKTGLGKGKINAPGGRVEPGETLEQAAIRETNEEVGLTCWDLTECGQLHFIFTGGYSLHGTVFITDKYKGEPVETVEAKPFWCHLNKIPYTQMWEDDRHWLPHVLNGFYIKGFFIFDDDKMLSHRVDVSER